MKRKNIISSIFLSSLLVLGTGCNKKETKETGFTIDTDEVKLIYKLGEELDLDGLKVYSAKDVGTYKELDDDDFKIEHSYNKDELGSYKVEIKYKKFPTKYFYVEVEKHEQTPLTVMPNAELTVESITMEIVNGVEYRIDNQSYTNSGNIFSNLQPGSTHTIYARYGETSTHLASTEISKTFTLPLGPAKMSLNIENDRIATTIDYIYFDLVITPNDNAGDDNLYIAFISEPETELTYQYQNGEDWITLEDNIFSPEGFRLENQKIKFRVNSDTPVNTTLSAKMYTKEDNELKAATAATSISFILGSAKATLLQSGKAIVDEAHIFNISIALNDDTYLRDELMVYGQIDFNTSQVPNDAFIIEFYDTETETWITTNKELLFKFKTDGMYLDDEIYKFRFTPIGQTYDNFTFFVNFKLKQNDSEVLSTKVVIDVIDLSTAKGDALLEVDNVLNNYNFTTEQLATIQEKASEVKSNITAATSGTQIETIMNEYYAFLDSL